MTGSPNVEWGGMIQAGTAVMVFRGTKNLAGGVPPRASGQPILTDLLD